MEYLQTFENFKTKNVGQTHLMTLSEYQTNVTPILKEYNKFIKNNSQYFIPSGFYGLEHLTYPEFITKQVNSLEKQKFLKTSNKEYFKEYATKEWLSKGKVLDTVPNDIYSTYTELFNKLKNLFGEQIDKVEKDEVNSNKRSIRRAIDKDYYIDDMLDSKLNPSKLNDILSSVGIKMTKRLLDMKYKVETEGYTRSISNKLAERDTSLAIDLRNLLLNNDVVTKLKDIKKSSIINLVNKFEESEIKNIYTFSDKLRKSNPDASIILNKLFERENPKDYSTNSPYIRVDNFDTIIEKMLTDYINSIITKFISRVNTKLAVINKKLGLPKMTMGEFEASNDIEGQMSFEWTNGFRLELRAKIILAGGTWNMILHERYLLIFYKDGKKINLEEIDNVN